MIGMERSVLGFLGFGRSRAAFEQAMLPHLDAAYTLARWMLRRPEDAEDAVQDAYLRAFKGFASYAGGDARCWLLAIVRNACLSALRRRAAMDNVIVLSDAIDRLEVAEPDPGARPDRSLELKQDAAALHAALAALPVLHREILVLREIEELSYREIATVLAIPVGTVMSRLSRAREQLAAALRAAGPREREGAR